MLQTHAKMEGHVCQFKGMVPIACAKAGLQVRVVMTPLMIVLNNHVQMVVHVWIRCKDFHVLVPMHGVASFANWVSSRVFPITDS